MHVLGLSTGEVIFLWPPCLERSPVQLCLEQVELCGSELWPVQDPAGHRVLWVTTGMGAGLSSTSTAFSLSS